VLDFWKIVETWKIDKLTLVTISVSTFEILNLAFHENEKIGELSRSIIWSKIEYFKSLNEASAEDNEEIITDIDFIIKVYLPYYYILILFSLERSEWINLDEDIEEQENTENDKKR